MKPLASWTRDLIQSVDQLEKWSSTAHAPNIFWMSGFTFPTGFLTAVLQTSARLYNVILKILYLKYFSVFLLLIIKVYFHTDSSRLIIMGVYRNANGGAIYNSSAQRRRQYKRLVSRSSRMGQKSWLPSRARTYAIGLSNACDSI